MTKKEQTAFENILGELGFEIKNIEDGKYIITHPETLYQCAVQTKGYNLRYSVRALTSSAIYEEICL